MFSEFPKTREQTESKNTAISMVTVLSTALASCREPGAGGRQSKIKDINPNSKNLLKEIS